MLICTQTPFRISLVGGGTDLPSFYREHGPGCVVSFTIDRSMYVMVNEKFDGKVRVSYSVTENVESAEIIQHDIARECLLRMGIKKGIEVVSVADIPGRGTGLGSSSAYAVGLLNALSQYRIYHGGEQIEPFEDVAEEACKIEIERCGKPIGKQDQYAVAYGGLNQFIFNQDGTVTIPQKKFPFTDEMKKKMEDHMLLFWTGIIRPSRQILEEQSKINELEKIESLKAMSAIARSLARDLFNGNLERIGIVLHQNWLLKRSLVDGISNPQIDRWYEKAMRAGAQGGKICGAGAGGFLFFWADPECHMDIKTALGLRHIPFKIDQMGTRLYGDER